MTELSYLAEREPFEVTMRRQSAALRARCDSLLDTPTTDEEWQDADLESMDPWDATDEQLIGFWKANRRAAELDPEGFPLDLRQVTDWMDDGIDPVAAVEALADAG